MVVESGQPNPNPNPDPGSGGAAPVAAPQAPAQPSAYDELAGKKGWKSTDDAAKSYAALEIDRSQRVSASDMTKQQLEAQGFTVNEKGEILDKNTQQPIQAPPAPQIDPLTGLPIQPPPAGQPPAGQPPAGQPPYQPQPGQPVYYDPYTGQPLTNPVDIQLAGMPMSQRIGTVFQVLANQREQQQTLALQSEQEILATPEAKGFEDDLKKVMALVPLAKRADKNMWSDALLRIKGTKYNEAVKGAGAEGVNAFINKAGTQPMPPAGAPAAGEGLTQEQETSYQWYEKNQPGMFKDRKDFLANINR